VEGVTNSHATTANVANVKIGAVHESFVTHGFDDSFKGTGFGNGRCVKINVLQPFQTVDTFYCVLGIKATGSMG
jgi:hypothetical protein